MMKRVQVTRKKNVKSKELSLDKSSIQLSKTNTSSSPKVSDGGYLWVG